MPNSLPTYPSLPVIDTYGFTAFSDAVIPLFQTMNVLLTNIDAIMVTLNDSVTAIKTDVASITTDVSDIKTQVTTSATKLTDLYTLLNTSYIDVRLVYSLLGVHTPLPAGPAGLLVEFVASHVIVDSGTVDATISGYTSLTPLPIEGHVIVDSGSVAVSGSVDSHNYVLDDNGAGWGPVPGLTLTPYAYIGSVSTPLAPGVVPYSLVGSFHTIDESTSALYIESGQLGSSGQSMATHVV